MALEQDKVQYLDDWQDLKDYTKKKHEAAEKEKQDRDVTRTFVDSQISTAEQKDNQEEQAEYAKIYQKIADISAGGGVDLSPYLKIEDASANFATKADIPDLADYTTQQQLQEAVSDKATIAQVSELNQKVDAIDLTPYAKIDDVSAEYAKKSEISGMATEQYVQEQIAELVDGAPEELNSFKELSDALKDQGDAVSAINAVLATKADASTVYTKEQADAKFLTEHQDLSSYATTEYVNNEIARVEDEIPSVDGLVSVEQLNEAVSPKANSADVEATYAKKSDIPSLDGYATKSEVNAALENKADKADIPSVDDFATREELTAAVADKATIAQVAAVDQKVDAIDLTPYATKNDVSVFATKEEVAEKADAAEMTAALADKATISQVAAVEQKVYAIDLTPYATKEEVADGDASVLNNVLGKMWNKSGDYFQTKKTVNGKTAMIWNEVDGGGSIYETSELKSFVGVNDGGDVSTGVHVQIYSKNKADNKGARLNVNPTGIFYGVGTSAVISPETELAVKGDIPSVEGLASVSELNAAVDELNVAIGQKADTVDVSVAVENIETALEGKAESTDVPSKEEFEALKGQFEELKQLVYEYAPGSEQEAIADGEIADLSPDNKSVHVDEPMKSVVLPESTGTLYTVEVPLRDESSVELTSSKAATIANISDEPVNTTFTAPEPTSSSNTKIYLSGLFEDIELTNVNLDKSSSYDAAIISGNVTITEANTKPVTVAAEFSNGCVVKNESDCDVTLNNKSAVGSSVTILAPGSTVTIQGGQWEELESTVGDDTLYINNSAHIKKLVVNKGNCIVNSYDVSNCVDEVINETEYTVSPRVIEVTSKTEWNKASSVDALYEIRNDISTNIRIAPGIFGSQAKMKLNGYTVDCTDANGAFVLRGNSHYIIENGTINATGYGIWLAGPGTVELKDVTISADTHALYIEKTGGQIITTGNCRFKVTNDDKRYVANYLDATYTDGWTHGFHFGENTEFEDFNPAESMGEPGGPVNLLDEGYHTESYTEGEHTIYKVVKDSE